MRNHRSLLLAVMGVVLACGTAFPARSDHIQGSNDASLSRAIVLHLHALVPEALCAPPQCAVVIVDTVVRLIEHQGPWMPARRPSALILSFSEASVSHLTRFRPARVPEELESFAADSAAAWLGLVSDSDTAFERTVVTMISSPQGSYEGVRTIASFRRSAASWSLISVRVEH